MRLSLSGAISVGKAMLGLWDCGALGAKGLRQQRCPSTSESEANEIPINTIDRATTF